MGFSSYLNTMRWLSVYWAMDGTSIHRLPYVIIELIALLLKWGFNAQRNDAITGVKSCQISVIDLRKVSDALYIDRISVNKL